MKRLLLGLVVFFGLIQTAEARHHYVRHDHNQSYRVASGDRHLVRGGVVGGRPSGCRGIPWCGCWMRQHVGHDPGSSYNLARNWAHWGKPAAGPAPGVIGVMPHHVFQVVYNIGHGIVMAISGNDGHAVRVRPRSTARVIAWREELNGAKVTASTGATEFASATYAGDGGRTRHW